MTTERLLSIGSFAMLSGLTITALRHYDAVGLLPPAATDPSSGYRRYRPDQVRTARLIGALRRLEGPHHGEPENRPGDHRRVRPCRADPVLRDRVRGDI